MIDQSGMSPFVQSSFAYAHHWGPLATVAGQKQRAQGEEEAERGGFTLLISSAG